MKRSARLQAARHWLPTYGGKNVVKGYARWFGVDLGCALQELRLLGVSIDPAYAERLLTTLRNRNRPCRSEQPSDADNPEGYGIDWDDHFASIAGFTSGGAPFGRRWEEMDPELAHELVDARQRCRSAERRGGGGGAT